MRVNSYDYFTDEEAGAITLLIPWFLDSARRYNVNGSDMNDGVFAALIVTLMRNEDAFARFRNDLNAQLYSSFQKPFLDEYGALITDKALGPANIEESTLWEILHARVRKTSFWQEQTDPREYFDFCTNYNLKFSLSDDVYYILLAKVQSLDVSIDLTGAVIQEGIVRTQLMGERPYIFNLMMWWLQGVSTDYEINDQQAKQRGRARILGEGILPEAIDIVGPVQSMATQIAALFQMFRLMPPTFQAQSYNLSYKLGPSYDRYVREKGGQ